MVLFVCFKKPCCGHIFSIPFSPRMRQNESPDLNFFSVVDEAV